MRALGLMSGTSADGISAALIETGPPVKILSHANFPFPKKIQAQILRLGEARAPEICEANVWIGELFARAAKRFLRSRVDVIGSHGQTVWHVPRKASLQLGEPSVIAERTGVTTVADFRPRDIAAGGEGAPLVPYFDRAVFGKKKGLALQNIGGIANVTFTGSNLAFDQGPGNCLIDDAMRMTLGLPYDKGGRVARSGTVSRALLDLLLAHPYFKRRPPKSTGRETFHRDWLLSCCTKVPRMSHPDLVATLTAFTAKTIAEGIEKYAPAKIQQVVVSGGGALNRTLLKHLEWLLWPALVRPSTVYGLPLLAKEPAAFALLAADSVRGIANNLPSATGARRAVVLGKIVPGDNFTRLLRVCRP